MFKFGSSDRDQANKDKPAWERMQEKTFLAWANTFIKEKGLKINDLQTDFSNGILLIHLIEAISKTSLGKFNKNPKIDVEKIQNLNLPIAFINQFAAKQKIKVKYSAEGVLNGDMKQILGMIWILMNRYVEALSEEELTAKEGLLRWCQNKVHGLREDTVVKDFHYSWQSGLAFCALIYRHYPQLIPQFPQLSKETHADRSHNLALAFSIAEKELGIPRVLDVEDMADGKPDEKSVMAQVAFYWKRFAADKNVEMAGRRVNKFVTTQYALDGLRSDYNSRATALREWIIARLAFFERKALTANVQELLEEHIRYKNTDKAEKMVESMALEALLFWNLNAKLRAESRAPFVPAEPISVPRLKSLWEALGVAEREYEAVVRIEIEKSKKTDVLQRSFAAKADKIHSWIKEKSAYVSSAPRRFVSLEQAQAAAWVHSTFEEEMQGYDATRTSALASIASALHRTRPPAALGQQVDARLNEIKGGWAALQRSAAALNQDLQKEVLRHQELESLKLKYAKDAQAFNLWLEEMLDTVHEPIASESVEDAQAQKAAHEELVRSKDARKPELLALESLARRLQSERASETAYSRFPVDNLLQRWQQLQKSCVERGDGLSAEIALQLKYDQLRRQYAAAADDLAAKLQRVHDAIAGENVGRVSGPQDLTSDSEPDRRRHPADPRRSLDSQTPALSPSTTTTSSTPRRTTVAASKPPPGAPPPGAPSAAGSTGSAMARGIKAFLSSKSFTQPLTSVINALEADAAATNASDSTTNFNSNFSSGSGGFTSPKGFRSSTFSSSGKGTGDGSEDKVGMLKLCQVRLEELRPQWMHVCSLDDKMVEAKVSPNNCTSNTLQVLGVKWDKLERLIKDRLASLEEEKRAASQPEVAPQLLAELDQCFKHFDKSKSGYLEKHEFEACLQLLDTDIAREEIDAVLEQCKRSNVPGIDLDTFTKFMISKRQDKGSYEQILGAFSILAGSKPHINRAELRPAQLSDPLETFLLSSLPPASATSAPGGVYDYAAYLRSIYVTPKA